MDASLQQRSAVRANTDDALQHGSLVTAGAGKAARVVFSTHNTSQGKQVETCRARGTEPLTFSQAPQAAGWGQNITESCGQRVEQRLLLLIFFRG
ncbi:MAG: hypothetical protein WEA04_04525 [Candidatus Andersenbacteria bacterium]